MVINNTAVLIRDLVDIGFYLILGGLTGVFLGRNNLVMVLLALELAFLGLNFLFIVASCHLDNMEGQLMSIVILAVAAGETSLGLALVVLYYRHNKIIFLDALHNLKG